jgi:hypothetical protein
VASCPGSGYGSCYYDTLAGKPVPVPGAQKEWIAIGIDSRSRLYYRDEAMDKPESLLRLEPTTGRVTTLAALSPRDRAGVFGVLDEQTSYLLYRVRRLVLWSIHALSVAIQSSFSCATARLRPTGELRETVIKYRNSWDYDRPVFRRLACSTQSCVPFDTGLPAAWDSSWKEECCAIHGKGIPSAGNRQDSL